MRPPESDEEFFLAEFVSKGMHIIGLALAVSLPLTVFAQWKVSWYISSVKNHTRVDNLEKGSNNVMIKGPEMEVALYNMRDEEKGECKLIMLGDTNNVDLWTGGASGPGLGSTVSYDELWPGYRVVTFNHEPEEPIELLIAVPPAHKTPILPSILKAIQAKIEEGVKSKRGLLRKLENMYPEYSLFLITFSRCAEAGNGQSLAFGEERYTSSSDPTRPQLPLDPSESDLI